ncbi:MAG: ABC transporter permease [Solirubrobacteraceae bacterium]|jgi:ABC-2 type transport system permease protein
MTRTLATTLRVLRQLRHDPRTVALLLGVPAGLMTIFRFVFEHQHATYEAAGPALMVLFPLFTMFLVSSVALLRERTSGTLERLLTTPLNRFSLLAGYALAFTLLATLQAAIVTALSLEVLGLNLAGDTALVVVLAAAVALLGLGLGLLASAFAHTEFQVVQFFPATILPQLLLCGLLVPRAAMGGVLHAISDVLPMSYAVDGIHHLAVQPGAGAGAIGDLAIVLAFAAGAILLGALTLRRRED